MASPGRNVARMSRSIRPCAAHDPFRRLADVPAEGCAQARVIRVGVDSVAMRCVTFNGSQRRQRARRWTVGVLVGVEFDDALDRQTQSLGKGLERDDWRVGFERCNIWAQQPGDRCWHDMLPVTLTVNCHARYRTTNCAGVCCDWSYVLAPCVFILLPGMRASCADHVRVSGLAQGRTSEQRHRSLL